MLRVLAALAAAPPLASVAAPPLQPAADLAPRFFLPPSSESSGAPHAAAPWSAPGGGRGLLSCSFTKQIATFSAAMDLESCLGLDTDDLTG